MEFFFNYKNRWYRSDELPPQDFADDQGLLAWGGEYSGACFERAYRRGIFPWPSENFEDIPWFCPPERFVLYPSRLHVSHSLKRTMKHHPFKIGADKHFAEVIHHCATVPRQDHGTWITEGMESAFMELHDRGIAHSVECTLDGKLVGGFYGTCIGKVFGGESMFSLVADATKIAMVTFVRRAAAWGIPLIDCQCPTDNMARYGAESIPRHAFLHVLNEYGNQPLAEEFWMGEWPN